MGCDFCHRNHVQGCWNEDEAKQCGNLGDKERKVLDRGKENKIMRKALEEIANLSPQGRRAKKLAKDALDKVSK